MPDAFGGRRDRGDVALLLLPATQALAIWAVVNPGYFDSSRASDDEGKRATLRRGEAIGGVLIIGFGALVSYALDGDPLPALIALVVALVMVGLTEHALRSPHKRKMDPGAAAPATFGGIA